MCVNLIPGHTYYEYAVWVLKPGMTQRPNTNIGKQINPKD
jgi:hypothetical protein